MNQPSSTSGTTSQPTPPGQEYQQLNQLSRQTFDMVQRYRGHLPQDLVEHLNALSGTLMRTAQTLKRGAEEQANLVALTEVSQVVNSSLEINDVLRIVMDTLVRLSRAERGFLMLKDEHGQFVTRIARNWEQESIDSSEHAVSRSIINRVMADGQPVLTTNAQEDPRFGQQESIIMHNLRSIICVPLMTKGELIGVIYADNRFQAGIFSEMELNLLSTFANQAAVAVENARLFESVRNTLEEVTELKNLMDNVFASIASGVITAGLSDEIILCNNAATAILGNQSGSLTGLTLTDISPFEIRSDDGGLYHQIDVVRQTGQQIVGYEVNPVLPVRGAVNLSFNLSPLKDAAHITQGVAIVMNDLTENKKLEAQRRLFERMVSPAVISQLDPDQLQLGGKRVEITTLFADVRGFTRFSESLDPVKLVQILNQYLAMAADAVLTHEGTIDKFLGDAVMAWYNAPIPQIDHTMRAINTALEIRKHLAELHDRLPPEYHLSFGVGIHYGEAVLGLVGTEKRLEYTAIGDSVNTAKRIQENSGAGQIVISRSVYDLVAKYVAVNPLEAMTMKGKSQPIEVYDVIGLK